MNQTSLIARVIGLALAVGSLTPALAQRGPPERGDRDRQEAREERDDAETREERRARRSRGQADQAPVPADVPRRVAAPAALPAPDNPRAAEVRQDRVARERNAQREAARQQGEPWRGNAPSDAQERGRQQREGAIEAAQQAERRQQEAWAREQEARQQVERRPAQNRQSAPAVPPAVQRQAGYEDRNRPDGRDGRRDDGDRRDDRGRDDRDRYDDRNRYGGRDDRRDGGSRARDRLPERDRQRLIVQQRQSVDTYRRAAAARHVTEQRRISSLQQQRRMQQYRYQQRYWQRHREMQNRWATLRIDFNNDPYFYTPASYRYQRGGRYYEVNRYAADVLEQAIQFGYEEGVRAGEADRYDGWRGGYRDNFAYLDANYGYDGYYVSQAEYNHYFREGFRRGYEDGFEREYRYGQRRGDDFLIMASVLQLILGLEEFR